MGMNNGCQSTRTHTTLYGVGYDIHQSYPYPLHQSLSDTNEQQVGPLKDWVSVSQTTVS